MTTNKKEVFAGIAVIIVFCFLFWFMCSYQDYKHNYLRLKSEGSLKEYQTNISNIEQTLYLAYQLTKPQQEVFARVLYRQQEIHKIDWQLFAATIRIESNFKERLKSSAECKGLLQLKEPTFKAICKKQNIHHAPDTTIWNFCENIYAGCAYLADNLDSTKNYKTTLACYLAGPCVKNRTIKAQEAIDKYTNDVWIEYEKLKAIERGLQN